jgi:integrase/recombinase XerC
MQTLTPLIVRYLNVRASTGTYAPYSVRVVRARLMSLSAHHGARPLNQLTDQRIEAWLASSGATAPRSYNAYLSSARKFCVWAVKNGHLRVDPTATVERRRLPRSVPRAMEQQSIVAILDACHDPIDTLAVWLMVGCGLRRGEVARATWADYDQTAHVLLVHGKGGHERLVPVPTAVRRALDAMPGWHSGPLLSHDGQPYQPASIGKRVVNAMKRAEVKHAPRDGVSGHALRHTAASDVLDQCGDLRVVQEMLGHAQLSSTSIYLRRAGIPRMAEAMEGRDYGHAA